MVKLHVKRGNNSQFLYETALDKTVDEVVEDVTFIYNGRLKIGRICNEMEELAKHGTLLPPNIMGLTDEQVEELKLLDEWGEKCVPSGGWSFNKDPIGRRNGKQPNEHMQDVIKRTTEEAKAMISEKQVEADVCLTQKMVQNALDILRGAIMIVYPMNLPPHDVICHEFENTEDLSGMQASLEPTSGRNTGSQKEQKRRDLSSQMVIEVTQAQMWFSGKEMCCGRTLAYYLGRNEKTKVIVKLQKQGQGPPGREPVISEEERKQMMLHAYRHQEELKKLEQDTDDQYLNASWADSGSLKRSFQGLSNISWRPK